MTAYREEHKINESENIEFLKSLPIVGTQPVDDKEEAFLREVCEFEFVNLKEPGVFHKFSYGNTKRNKTLTLIHGAKYKLPRFIARHLESCATPIYEWRPDGLGRLIKAYTGSDPRFQMRQVYSRAA